MLRSCLRSGSWDPSSRTPGPADALRGPGSRTHASARPRARPPARPPAARRPGPRALTCSRSRILGAARLVQRPASQGPAARPPQPRPHASPRRGALMGLARLTSCLPELGPQSIPPRRVPRRPRRGERPGEGTRRPAAPHKETGRGPGQQEGGRTGTGRAAGAAERPGPGVPPPGPCGRIRGGGGCP